MQDERTISPLSPGSPATAAFLPATKPEAIIPEVLAPLVVLLAPAGGGHDETPFVVVEPGSDAERDWLAEGYAAAIDERPKRGRPRKPEAAPDETP